MIHVQDIMSRPVVTCRASDSLDVAARLMWECDCGLVVVIGDEQQVAGVVTDRDICVATWSRGTAPNGLLVRDAMTTPVFSCQQNELLERALSSMAIHQLRRLPVIDDSGAPVGLLSVNNVTRFVATVPDATLQQQLVAVLAAISQPRLGEASHPPIPAVVRTSGDRAREQMAS